MPNPRGHKATLVQAHPGNMNAVRYGVHSARLLAERTAEIAGDLSSEWEFAPAELVVVHEVARISALIDAIDRDLQERGVVRRGGRPSYLLDYRARLSRQLERWFDKLLEISTRHQAFAAEEDRRRERELPQEERVRRFALMLAFALDAGVLEEHPHALDPLAAELVKRGWMPPKGEK